MVIMTYSIYLYNIQVLSLKRKAEAKSGGSCLPTTLEITYYSMEIMTVNMRKPIFLDLSILLCELLNGTWPNAACLIRRLEA